MVVCFLLASLRLLHLDADTPDSQWFGSAAIFVDEGYKTLSPRNLLLFGDSHWNPGDNYPGWMSRSPLTQWPYYLVFSLLGAKVESARIVTILFFLLLLLGFTLLMRARYPASLLLLGVLLLGTIETLFFFSRVALFEIPIAAFVYLPLFLLGRRRHLGKVPALGLVLGFALITTLGIKASALLCFGPITAGVMLAMRLREDSRLRIGRFELLTAALFVLVVVLTAGRWLQLLDISPITPRAALLNPLTLSSGLVMAAGWLAVSHALLAGGRRFLADPYRAALVCLMTLGPLALAMFPHNPLRYWVPLLPAYALLIVEWLHLRLWQRSIPAALSPARVVASFTLLVAAAFSLGQVIDHQLLARLDTPGWIPLLKGSGTGLWNSPRFLAAALLGLVVALLAWRWRRRALSGRLILAILVALVALEGAQSLLSEGRFFASPTRNAREISDLFEERLPDGTSIAGDWAPRFALGTDLKALYMTTSFNHPKRILETKPDYFVFCDDPEGDGRKTRQLLRESADVSLGERIIETSYLGFDVIVYPLRYSEVPATG